jgi:nitrogen fixation/metabolism regulation signal transduction histidine kinase
MASDTPRRTSENDRRRFFERRLTWLAASVGLPGALAVGLLLWIGHFSPQARVIVAVATVAGWGILVYLLRQHVIRPLQTIANMGAALHEGDFSMRIRGASADDALGIALLELNRLGGVLQEQRRSALDASALARAVMREIDIAVFAFDDAMILRLVNRAGERLIGHRSEWAIGRDAQTLGLAECLTGEPDRTLDVPFKGTTNRWQLRRTTLRRAGRPHQLVVLADLSRALRDEERSAWQRLLRVLGHEINNSLAPIHSLAATLRDHVSRINRAPDWEDDLDQGLAVIESRSAALSRFMASYAQLARLPAPTRVRVDVEEWVRRIARMEMRVAVVVEPGPPVLLNADADQLDQLLINLIRNAADASLETGGGVHVGWDATDSAIDVWVRDEGLGLPDTGNLFVPFFTTKQGGSGIGLVLSRQIAEAHGGSLDLVDGDGCEARVHLPIG